MDNRLTKKRRLSLLLTATMGIALLFGATACNNSNNNGGSDTNVESNSPDAGVPDSGMEAPEATPSASPSAT
jgi:hypothetical protein